MGEVLCWLGVRRSTADILLMALLPLPLLLLFCSSLLFLLAE